MVKKEELGKGGGGAEEMESHEFSLVFSYLTSINTIMRSWEEELGVEVEVEEEEKTY